MSYRLGSYFLIAALVLAVLADIGQGPARLLTWPAISMFLVGMGYLGLGPAVLGKRPDGRIAPWALVLHAPFFALTWLLWHLTRLLTRERAFHEVAPGLFLGRRLLPRELTIPGESLMLVDLTAEFPAPAAITQRCRYRLCATLDGGTPAAQPMLALCQESLAAPGPIYVHCAMGHGRSATFMALLLIRKGLSRDVDQAIALIRRQRPTVRLTRGQRAVVAALSSGGG